MIQERTAEIFRSMILVIPINQYTSCEISAVCSSSFHDDELYIEAFILPSFYHFSVHLELCTATFYTLLSLNLILQHKHCSITTVPYVQAMSPTSTRCVHSNVYGLGIIH